MLKHPMLPGSISTTTIRSGLHVPCGHDHWRREIPCLTSMFHFVGLRSGARGKMNRAVVEMHLDPLRSQDTRSSSYPQLCPPERRKHLREPDSRRGHIRILRECPVTTPPDRPPGILASDWVSACPRSRSKTAPSPATPRTDTCAGLTHRHPAPAAPLHRDFATPPGSARLSRLSRTVSWNPCRQMYMQ